MDRLYHVNVTALLLAIVAGVPAVLAADGPPVKPDEIKVSKPSGNLNLKIGHPSSISFYDVPTQMTHERLNKQGWKVESINFTRTDLNTQALVQGTVQMSIALQHRPIAGGREGRQDQVVNGKHPGRVRDDREEGNREVRKPDWDQVRHPRRDFGNVSGGEALDFRCLQSVADDYRAPRWREPDHRPEERTDRRHAGPVVRLAEPRGASAW